MTLTNLGRTISTLLFAVVALVLFAPAPVAAQENAEDVLVRVNGTVDLPAGDALDVLVAVNSETRVAGSVRDTLPSAIRRYSSLSCAATVSASCLTIAFVSAA